MRAGKDRSFVGRPLVRYCGLTVAQPRYWITSSAVASSVSGMVRPSALAVIVLMISSMFVDCWTGRSAGFSPLYGALEVKHYFTAFSTSLIPVSLFDLKSRFFAPTHMCWRPARTGAVKVGHRSTLATRSVVSRPRLDRPEHGGTLGVVGMTCSRGARCRGALFHGILHFLDTSFFVRLEIPFLRPDPHVLEAGAHRGCQGRPSLYAGHTLRRFQAAP